MKKKLIGLLLTLFLILPTSNVYAATDANHNMKLLQTSDYTSATLVDGDYAHYDFSISYLHQLTLNKKNYLVYCMDEGYASPSGDNGDGKVYTSDNITNMGDVKLTTGQINTLKNILAAGYQDTGSILTKSYSKANLRNILATQILVWEVMNDVRPAGEYGAKSSDLVPTSTKKNNWKFVNDDSSLMSAYKSILTTANRLAGNEPAKSFGKTYTMHWNDGTGQYEVTGINISFYSVDSYDKNAFSVSGKTSKNTISITSKTPVIVPKDITFKYVKGTPITSTTKLKYFKFKVPEGNQRLILSNYQKKTTGKLSVKTESGYFQLAKLDAGNNKGLKGAKFQLFKCSSESSCDSIPYTDIDMTNSDISEKIEINKSGLYKIVETVVPAGYEKVDDFFVTLTIKNNGQITAKIDPSVRHVTQNAATSDVVLRLIVKNESKVFNIKKIDGNSGAEIKGAEFKIKTTDGTAVTFKQLADGSYQYDENGTITNLKSTNFSSYTVNALPVGEYVLEEVSVPYPYVMSSKQLERETKFKIDATQFLQVYNYSSNSYVKAYDLSITVKNFKTRVKVVKTGTKSARIGGVVFELYDSAKTTRVPITGSNGAYAYTPAEDPVQLVTNTNGEFTIDNLPEGTYYLKEVDVGDSGYSLPEDPWTKIDIFVNRDNATPYNYTKEVRNAKESFCFYKIDEDGNYLDKGEFKLQVYNQETASYEDVALVFNENDKTFSIDTSGNSDIYIFSPVSGGQTCFVDIDSKSKYKIVELQAPEGFVLPSSSTEAETEIEFNEYGYATGDAVIMNRKVTVGGGARAEAELVINIQTGQNRIHYVIIISVILAAIAGLIILKKKIDKK